MKFCRPIYRVKRTCFSFKSGQCKHEILSSNFSCKTTGLRADGLELKTRWKFQFTKKHTRFESPNPANSLSPSALMCPFLSTKKPKHLLQFGFLSIQIIIICLKKRPPKESNHDKLPSKASKNVETAYLLRWDVH
jgi:hypothetical protein